MTFKILYIPIFIVVIQTTNQNLKLYNDLVFFFKKKSYSVYFGLLHLHSFGETRKTKIYKDKITAERICRTAITNRMKDDRDELLSKLMSKSGRNARQERSTIAVNTQRRSSRFQAFCLCKVIKLLQLQ